MTRAIPNSMVPQSIIYVHGAFTCEDDYIIQGIQFEFVKDTAVVVKDSS